MDELVLNETKESISVSCTHYYQVLLTVSETQSGETELLSNLQTWNSGTLSEPKKVTGFLRRMDILEQDDKRTIDRYSGVRLGHRDITLNLDQISDCSVIIL